MAMTMDDRHRASMAEDLLNNDVFAEALTDMRFEALTALGAVDPTNTDEIRRLQAVVACTANLKDVLTSYITRTGRSDGGMSLSNQQDDDG